MSELTTELRRMADDAARQARPSAAAEVIRQGDRRRRRSLARQSLGALSVAGAAGASVALGLGLTGSASPYGPGTIRTAAFTLVKNANGTATLSINSNVLFEPGTLQSDLEHDGIPAKVTVGSFCSSDPVPAGILRVVSVQRGQRGQRGDQGFPRVAPKGATSNTRPMGQPGPPPPIITINPATMPAGTELSFGNFQAANGEQTYFALIDTGSYTCTSTAPVVNVSQGILGIGFGSAQSQGSSSSPARRG